MVEFLVICNLDRMVKTVILAYLFTICFVWNLSAQYKLFPNYLNIQNGLSDNQILGALVDEEGFIWMATSTGLNRFDGIENTIFNHIPFDSTSLSDDFLVALIQDKKENIWILPKSGGINRFNPKTKKVERFLKGYTKENELIDLPPMIYVVELENGVLWFISHTGLYKYDYIKNKIILEFTNIEKYFRIRNNRKSLFIQSWKGSLSIYYPETKKLIKLEIPEEISVNYDYDISLSRENEFIIYRQNHLYIFEENTQKIKSKISFEKDIKNIHFDEDKAEIKVITVDFAIYTIDLESFEKQTHTVEIANTSLPEFVIINNIINYSDNLLFISTFNYGLIKLVKEKTFFKTVRSDKSESDHLFNKSIRSILPLNDSLVLIGGYNAFEMFNRKSKNSQLITYNADPKLYKSVGVAHSIIRNTFNPDEIVVGSEGEGMFVYNWRKDEISIFSKDAQLHHKFIRNFALISNRYLITNYSLYLIVYDLKTKSIANIPSDILKPIINVDVIVADNDDNLWIAQKKGTVSRFDNTFQLIEQIQVLDSLSTVSNSINSILKTKDNTLFLGTNLGLIRYSDNKKTIFRVNNGLPNNTINALLADKNENIWLSTNYGISVFGLKTNTFFNFTNEAELQATEFNRFAFASYNQELFFGGVNGLTFFNPEEFRPTNKTYPVYIETIETNKQKINVLDSKNDSKKMEFSYIENPISIHFTSPDFEENSLSRFYFKLEPINTDWQLIEQERFIQFQNLSARDYTFSLVYSTVVPNKDSFVSKLKFEIKPPFYDTVYFQLGVILGIVFLVSYYFYSKNKQLLYESNVQKTYTQKLLSLQEQERKRIADALHDSIGNQLMLVKMNLQFEENSLNIDQNTVENSTMSLLNETIKEIRKISHDLHPHLLVKIGLSKSIRALVESICKVSSIKFDVMINEVDSNIGKEDALILYRFIQESITNLLRYSNATHVRLNLFNESNYMIYELIDNGVGFNYSDLMSKSDGLAFRSLRERANILHAQISIESSPKIQTRILLKIPFIDKSA